MLGRLLGFSLIGGVLAGCATTAPDAKLLAAASPSTETPAVVSGEAAQACLTEQSFIKTVTPSESGIYSPGLTYTFAQRLQGAGKDSAAYAPEVRAYEFRARGTGRFGNTIDGAFACYYQLKNGQLRYLATLQADRDGRVNRHEFDRMVRQAYSKMSGKSRTEIFFGG